MFLHILVVGHTVFDHRAGDEVFQLVLIPLIESFELVIYIYDKVLTDISKCVLLLWIYLARIAVTVQFGWTEQIQKRGLELSLLARQHEAGMVAAFSGVHGVGYHCNKPFGEIGQPLLGVVDGNTRCKAGNGFR